MDSEVAGCPAAWVGGKGPSRSRRSPPKRVTEVGPSDSGNALSRGPEAAGLICNAWAGSRKRLRLLDCFGTEGGRSSARGFVRVDGGRHYQVARSFVEADGEAWARSSFREGTAEGNFADGEGEVRKEPRQPSGGR